MEELRLFLPSVLDEIRPVAFGKGIRVMAGKGQEHLESVNCTGGSADWTRRPTKT